MIPLYEVVSSQNTRGLIGVRRNSQVNNENFHRPDWLTTIYLTECFIRELNSLRPSDAIWRNNCHFFVNIGSGLLTHNSVLSDDTKTWLEIKLTDYHLDIEENISMKFSFKIQSFVFMSWLLVKQTLYEATRCHFTVRNNCVKRHFDVLMTEVIIAWDT